MIEISDLYRPLGQQLARYSLIDSLAVIHAYSQNLQNGSSIPSQVEVNAEVRTKKGREKGFFEWELDLIARESLAAGNMYGRFSLRSWAEFSTTINCLKELENSISERTGDFLGRNIFLELARIAHRQFPWQSSPNSRTLTRYYKIFSAPGLDHLVQSAIGVTTQELYAIGLAMTGLYLDHFAGPFPLDVRPLGIRNEAGIAFLRHFARPVSTLINLAKQTEAHSEDFAYSYNPLRQYPLINFYEGGRHMVASPIPTYLFHRFTSGLYFELCNEPSFGVEYGRSFQNYIGEVLSTALPTPQFAVSPEAAYSIGRSRKDTIDWIASDSKAHIFVECKTKRLRFAAKTAFADTTVLFADLDLMADAIVQTYKTIVDAEGGHYPNWRPDGQPIYPVVVTLEEWYMFSDPVTAFVEKRVMEKLGELGIGEGIAKRYPYSVASCEDFECLTRVIARHDIATVMGRRFSSGKQHWNTYVFLLDEFRDDVQAVGGGLFRDEMDEIHPALKDPHVDSLVVKNEASCAASQ